MGNLSQEFLRRKDDKERQQRIDKKKATAKQKRTINGGVIAGVIALLVAMAVATPFLFSAVAQNGWVEDDSDAVATLVEDDDAEVEVTETQLDEATTDGTQAAEAGNALLQGNWEEVADESQVGGQIQGDVAPVAEPATDVAQQDAPATDDGQNGGQPAGEEMPMLVTESVSVSGPDQAKAVAFADARITTLEQLKTVKKCAVAPLYKSGSTSVIQAYSVIFMTVQGNEYTFYGYFVDAGAWQVMDQPSIAVYQRSPSTGELVYDSKSTLRIYEDRVAGYMVPQGQYGVSDLYIAVRIGFLEYFEEMELDVEEITPTGRGFLFGDWQEVAVVDGTAEYCWKAEFNLGDEAWHLGFHEYEVIPEFACSDGYKPQMTYTLTSSNQSVATVTNVNGKVTVIPRGNGNTNFTITAYADGEIAGTESISATVSGAPTLKAQTVTATDKTVEMGKTVSIGAKTNGDGKLTYTSGNTAVATVSANGVVTPVKAGTAKITIKVSKTATYAEGTKTITVTVKAATPQLKTQTVTATDKTVEAGKTVAIGAKTDGDGKLTYASSDTSIATVDANGTITGVKTGTAKVTVKAAKTSAYAEGTRTITVTVTAALKAQVITAANKTVEVGKTVALGAKTSGDGKLTYASDKTAIATVNASGVVTGVKAGTAKITVTAAQTATYAEGKKVVTVTVTAASPTLKAQTITATNKSVKMGKTVALGAKTDGDGKLAYASDAPAVVTVDANGTVTPIKVGTAKITVTAAKTATYNEGKKVVTVTVAKGTPTISISDKTMSVDTNWNFAAYVSPRNAGLNVTYKSSNPSVATVSDTGSVTACSSGMSTITISVTGNDSYEAATKRVNVKVTKKWVTINATSRTLPMGSSMSLYASVSGDRSASFTYRSSDERIAKVSKKGTITPVGVGTARITVYYPGNARYASASKTVNVTVRKGQQQLRTSGTRSASVSYTRTKFRSYNVGRPFSVSQVYGKLTYEGGSSILKVDPDNGSITVKAGTKKGTYTTSVWIKATGDANYNSAMTAVTCRVTVY